MKMKTTLLALMALLSSASAMADYEFTEFCNDCMVTRVTCRQAGGGVDSGYLLSISSGGFAGVTMATISEETFSGGRELTKLVVEAKTDDQNHPGLIAYDGARFNLVINRGEESSGYAPARLRAQIGNQIVA